MNNSEFQQMTTADIHQAYGHIPALCQTMHSFEEFLDTSDPIPEASRWLIKTMVTAAKFGLTSMTELIDRLIKECELLTQQAQSAQSESKHFRQELDAERERKDRRIAELEEEIAQAKHAAQQPSKIVGYERSLQSIWTQPEKQLTGHHQSPATSFQQNGFGETEGKILGRFISKPNQTNKATHKSHPGSAQHAPVTSENRTDGQKPISEQIPMQQDIPAEDFIITSRDIERKVVGSSLLLTKILSRHIGRFLGLGGQNAKRLEREYGVKIDILKRQNQFEDLKIVISEGDEDRRRAASDDIIENLPVEVHCPNLQCYGHALRNATSQFNVQIDRTNPNIPGMTICGRLTNCRQAYYQLVGYNDNILYQ